MLQGFSSGQCGGTAGLQKRKRRAFTRESKAEVVGLCTTGDRSVGQVAQDLDLTAPAVRRCSNDAGTLTIGSREGWSLATVSMTRRSSRISSWQMLALELPRSRGHDRASLH